MDYLTNPLMLTDEREDLRHAWANVRMLSLIKFVRRDQKDVTSPWTVKPTTTFIHPKLVFQFRKKKKTDANKTFARVSKGGSCHSFRGCSSAQLSGLGGASRTCICHQADDGYTP